MREKKNFLRVMLSLLKIGAIGFGGGAALLPVLERELVENKKWMDNRQFGVSAAIASISPASLPVSLCAIWDARYSVISAFSYALPGPLMYLILLTGFSYIGEAGLRYLSFVSVGFIAFVLFLLFRFIAKNLRAGAETGAKGRYIAIMAAAFALTGGAPAGRLCSMLFGLVLPAPLFSVNVLTLMLLTFYLIIFMGSSKSWLKLCAAFPPALLYALANGKAGALRQWSWPLLGVMCVLASGSVVYDAVKNKNKPNKQPFIINLRPVRSLLLFTLIAVAFVTITYFVSKDTAVWNYSGKVVSSSLVSFGGGEVYIGISEATFVQTDFISEQAFNSQILGIANTLPGPVLVSIVTGIGYIYGSAAHGVAMGWLFGLLGLVLAVAVTASGALTLSVFFGLLKDSPRLHMIMQSIMPVVCGMLISTALLLLIQAASVLRSIGINVFVSAGTVLALFGAIMLLSKKFRLNDLWLLLISGAGTVVLGVLAG
ncbi:MAG: chromate transporter [Clostridia bacterium]|nr:chromate transporter [Clostridia bacterium]